MKSSHRSPTTIKISGDLLARIEIQKPRDKPLTTFIREAIERDLTRKKVQRSSKDYKNFLAEQPKEDAWLRDWESSRLERPVSFKKSKKKSKAT